MLITPNNFDKHIERFARYPRLITDTETDGLNPHLGNKICGVSMVGPDLRNACYFPFRHAPGGNLGKTHFRRLMQMMSDRDVLTFFNLMFDVEMCVNEGMHIPIYGGAEDVMLAAHLTNENEDSFRLKDLATKYVDPKATAAEHELGNLLADNGWDKGDMWRLHPKQVQRYACDDVLYTERLRRLYEIGLRDWQLWDIWQEVNCYSLAMVRLERRGMMVDVPLTKKYLKHARRMIKPSMNKIIKLAGYPINLNSNPQIQAFMGLPSVTKDILNDLTKQGDERAIALSEYRGWNKVISSYYAPFLEMLDGDAAIHANVKLHGTVSGRPSIEKPQLQAIPQYTKVYRVKDIFRARPGRTLISADYSQMELRLGAHYAGDYYLRKAFREGRNVHQFVADLADVTYTNAKRVNFALLYGTGATTLAKTMGCSVSAATKFLKAGHLRHPRYKTMYNAIQRMARKNEYIRMWSGRVRRYNTRYTQQGMYKALSNLIQGGVAEIMRYAITGVDMDLVQTGQADTLLQVHDQIILETDDANVSDTVHKLTNIMCDFPEFSVPFITDVGVGKRWGKLKDWKTTV